VRDAVLVTLGLVAVKKKLLSAIALLALMLLPVTVCSPEADSAASPQPEIRAGAGASGRN